MTIIKSTSSDNKVKVSTNDNASGTLTEKLVAGTGITLTENNDGLYETLTIDATGGGGGSALEIAEEGSSLDSAVDYIDFVGDSLTATQTASTDIQIEHLENFSYDEIASGVTITVRQYQQMAVVGAIDIVGTLDLIGNLGLA